MFSGTPCIFYFRIFIRAPGVIQIQSGVEKIALLPTNSQLVNKTNQIVGVRQGNNMATAFHPELTTDPRFHMYFVNLVLKTVAQDMV